MQTPSPAAANLTATRSAGTSITAIPASGRSRKRAGVPVDADHWEWWIGFYPLNQRPGRHIGDIAATFEQAHAAFEEAWRAYLPQCTEADFAENRRRRAFTAWKYHMHETGTPLPTQTTSGRSKCFCGAPLTIQSVDSHIEQAHMDMAC